MEQTGSDFRAGWVRVARSCAMFLLAVGGFAVVLGYAFGALPQLLAWALAGWCLYFAATSGFVLAQTCVSGVVLDTAASVREEWVDRYLKHPPASSERATQSVKVGSYHRVVAGSVLVLGAVLAVGGVLVSPPWVWAAAAGVGAFVFFAAETWLDLGARGQ